MWKEIVAGCNEPAQPHNFCDTATVIEADTLQNSDAQAQDVCRPRAKQLQRLACCVMTWPTSVPLADGHHGSGGRRPLANRRPLTATTTTIFTSTTDTGSGIATGSHPATAVGTVPTAAATAKPWPVAGRPTSPLLARAPVQMTVREGGYAVPPLRHPHQAALSAMFLLSTVSRENALREVTSVETSMWSGPGRQPSVASRISYTTHFFGPLCTREPTR